MHFSSQKCARYVLEEGKKLKIKWEKREQKWSKTFVWTAARPYNDGSIIIFWKKLLSSDQGLMSRGLFL